MRITAEQNERLTRVGPGTPMGDVFRRYWIPACLSEELPAPDAPPIRLRLLGEDLVAFRDSAANIGIVDAYCPHRRAPLFYGRNEECGLRCVYHGWKFDTSGDCVDMPSEPPYSKFRLRVRLKAYPTFESNGLVWTYMGPIEQMPTPPDFEWMRAPYGQRFRISKTGESCNYLQGIEGGVDTAHPSFAHNNDMSNRRLWRSMASSPRLELDVEPYGFRYAGIYNLSDEKNFLRMYHFVMPFQQMRPGLLNRAGEPESVPTVNGHIWVPIDDENTWVYNMITAADGSITISDDVWEEKEAGFGRGEEDYIPGTYWLKADLSNDFFIDREVQRTKTFTGIKGINTQDFAIQTAMGPIVDRSKEALASTDRAVQTVRRLLLEACDDVAAGRPPRGADAGPSSHLRGAEGVVSRDSDWRALAKDLMEAYW